MAEEANPLADLYPSSADAQEAPERPQGSTLMTAGATETGSDHLAGEEGSAGPTVPESVQELREGSVAGRLYDDAKRFQNVEMDPLFDRLEVYDQEQREALSDEYRRVFGDLGLMDGQAQELVSLANQALKEGSPGREGELEARAMLRERHGQKGAQRKLEDARALAQRDPRLANFLNQTGLGDHPRVVELLADRAHNQRSQGRL